MDVLSKSKNEDLAIFRAFAKRTLKLHAAKLKAEQDKVMGQFSEGFWKQRKYVTSDVSLKYTHNIVNRFVDMKRRTVRGRKVYNVNRADVHNKLIMKHYNGIKGDLTYGISEDVKRKIREDIANSEIVL
jgi:hypothetical protein